MVWLINSVFQIQNGQSSGMPGNASIALAASLPSALGVCP